MAVKLLAGSPEASKTSFEPVRLTVPVVQEVHAAPLFVTAQTESCATPPAFEYSRNAADQVEAMVASMVTVTEVAPLVDESAKAK